MATATPTQVRTVVNTGSPWADTSDALSANDAYATAGAEQAETDYLILYTYANINGATLTGIALHCKTNAFDFPDAVFKAAIVANAASADAAACAAALSGVTGQSVGDTEATLTFAASGTGSSTDGVVITGTSVGNAEGFAVDVATITYTEAGGGLSTSNTASTPGVLQQSLVTKQTDAPVSPQTAVFERREGSNVVYTG